MSINLLKAKKNVRYIVEEILTDEKLTKVLKNFGIKKGSEVMVIGSNYGKKSYLVLASGTTFAIDRSILEKVIVYE